jgi:hypothetical protein
MGGIMSESKVKQRIKELKEFSSVNNTKPSLQFVKSINPSIENNTLEAIVTEKLKTGSLLELLRPVEVTSSIIDDPELPKSISNQSSGDYSEEPKLFFSDENLINDVHDVHHVHPLDLSQALGSARSVIDNVLIDCVENPGAMGSPEFAEAVNLISKDKALWFEYRTKIKALKPSGVPMADIDCMAAPQSAGGDKQDSAAAELIELVMGKGELFYDNQADKAFLSIDIDDVDHTLAVGSKSFINWLSYAYYTATKCGNLPGKSASESAIKQASFALAGIAKHDGESEQVHLRVADHNGGHYLFIGDDKLQVIEVLPTGWQVLDNAPVKFWMPGSMQSLPLPKKNGDLTKLWEFVNIPENDRLLVLAWMLESFRAETPKPILALNGTQGSAKSSTQDKLRQLIDNNSVNLRGAPKDVEAVFVSAGCGWLVSYENLSHLTPAMQDAFCTLSTGGGFAGRKMYTNDEESIIDVKRPIIINSIPSVLTAQDVTDRAITLELPRIAYREESEINTAWDKAKPAIFGGLLDLFVKTLALMPTVKLINPPRMADFTRLGEAMTQALGNAPGIFDTLYKANRTEGISRSLEASPVAVAVRELVDNHSGKSLLIFSGTMKSLLEILEKYKQESHAWPKSPRGLGDVLRRQQPALASLGINVVIGKPGKYGVNVDIRKGEHGEHGEHSFKDIHPERKVLQISSVPFNAERF